MKRLNNSVNHPVTNKKFSRKTCTIFISPYEGSVLNAETDCLVIRMLHRTLLERQVPLL